MPEKTAQAIQISSVAGITEKSRVLPLAIAALICFAVSVTLGGSAWFLFGSRTGGQSNQVADVQKIVENSEQTIEQKVEIPVPVNQTVETAALNPAAETSAETEAKQPDTNQFEFEGVVKVEGGEVAVGGDDKRPWKRSIVADFAIAETEVTNAQYSEFVAEAKHAAPPIWKNGKFPDGTENYPVTNVSWRDADAFCRWLSKKLAAEVRLPTEAEWELAAVGRDGKKYPWGEAWDKEAANSLESGGKVSAVKSFPLNRSPAGAFDMVGNVWEWTRDKVTAQNGATDKMVEQALKDGQILRVVKGGSAQEKAAQIFAQSRYEIPETTKAPTVGFRYVVVGKQ